ncbi:hypothetical protein CR203_09585 [Salipaludibacillus neizhouensis]|uniref:Chorismate dehydratase n=1 Tax=Salipaludibacillus neizhouensis TaxID=885475 RepID=A0A3A9KAK7_9BACI|nr:menaquinone biosynthesis protein [Salipaludibacillus neizhouensis]RKL67592.1 hypothetical protein CR203_09585 [Salipaludibacillus neizhouensis]
MSLIVGEISYTNIRPMFHYIDRSTLINKGCEFVPAIPAKLNKEMKEGTIHVGGISSFAYGENAEKYKVLPQLSVSSPKSVGSIFLFSKTKIEDLDKASIALTSSSATSVNLLKIILQHFYQLDVHYETTAPDYTQMMSEHDACLLIGDDAILAKMNKPNHIFHYDLGALWAHFTNLPMTYAVFAVRKEAWKDQPDLLAELHEQFLWSKDKCMRDGYSSMIKSIKLELGGTTSFWRNYFSGLNYELTDRHFEGLYYYYKLAYDLKLLSKDVRHISIWNPADHFHSV